MDASSIQDISQSLLITVRPVTSVKSCNVVGGKMYTMTQKEIA